MNSIPRLLFLLFIGAAASAFAADRTELNHLAAEKPHITKRLTDAALAWRKSLP